MSRIVSAQRVWVGHHCQPDHMPEAQEFKVAFAHITRTVTRSQLQRAPESTLSRLFLHNEDEASLAAWSEGTVELFEVMPGIQT